MRIIPIHWQKDRRHHHTHTHKNRVAKNTQKTINNIIIIIIIIIIHDRREERDETIDQNDNSLHASRKIPF
jgi:hypothetical protein